MPHLPLTKARNGVTGEKSPASSQRSLLRATDPPQKVMSLRLRNLLRPARSLLVPSPLARSHSRVTFSSKSSAPQSVVGNFRFFFFFFFFFMIGFLSKASRPSGREAHKHERDWCCWCCGERRGSVRGPADPQSTRNSTQVAEMLGVPTTGSGCRVSGRTTGSSRPKDWRSAAPRSRGLGGGGRARST